MWMGVFIFSSPPVLQCFCARMGYAFPVVLVGVGMSVLCCLCSALSAIFLLFLFVAALMRPFVCGNVCAVSSLLKALLTLSLILCHHTQGAVGSLWSAGRLHHCNILSAQVPLPLSSRKVSSPSIPHSRLCGLCFLPLHAIFSSGSCLSLWTVSAGMVWRRCVSFLLIMFTSTYTYKRRRFLRMCVCAYTDIMYVF